MDSKWATRGIYDPPGLGAHEPHVGLAALKDAKASPRPALPAGSASDGPLVWPAHARWASRAWKVAT